MSDQSDRIADLERRLAATAEVRDSWKDGAETLAMQVKDLQREVAKLSADLTTRRSACDEESERADKAERELAEARSEASDCCDGYEGQIAMLQEVLKNTQSELAETQEALRAAFHE